MKVTVGIIGKVPSLDVPGVRAEMMSGLGDRAVELERQRVSRASGTLERSLGWRWSRVSRRSAQVSTDTIDIRPYGWRQAYRRRDLPGAPTGKVHTAATSYYHIVELGRGSVHTGIYGATIRALKRSLLALGSRRRKTFTTNTGATALRTPWGPRASVGPMRPRPYIRPAQAALKTQGIGIIETVLAKEARRV